MATTIDTYLPFDSGAGANVTEAGWREMMKHMLGSASGVIKGFDNDFSTIGDATGMQVKVSSGQCFIRGHYGRNASTRTVAIAASHATLNRRDLVILRADFVNNRIEIDVLTGTAAASPTLPTLTQSTTIWETLLAEVTVAAADTSLSAGEVLDRRVYTTGFAKYTRITSLMTIPATTFTDVIFNNISYATGDVTMDAGGTTFTLGRSGLWVLTAQHGFTSVSSAAPLGRSIQIVEGASTVHAETTVAAVGDAAINTYVTCTAIERFSAGNTVKVRAWHNHSAAISLVIGSVKFSLLWVGP